jgi:ribosomal protein S18 acetylase RimI-like enzyme
MKVRVQAARPEDVTVLAALVAGFRDHLGAAAPSDADLALHLPHVLRDPQIEFACAWLGDRAVGYAQVRFWSSVWARGLEAQLDDLFIAPEGRGQGAGRALLRHALARASARGARRFSLNTNEHNHTAQALYRSEGLLPQSHPLYPGGREVFWTRELLEEAWKATKPA